VKVAVMQPYFFPYIGYFQLIHAVDIFVIYDDVNYINRGWINRNVLKFGREEKLFSVPVEKISQNKKIRDLNLKDDAIWWSKFSKNLELNFASAPFRSETMELYHRIKDFPDRNLATFVGNSIIQICSHLALDTKIIYASELNIPQEYVGEQRIIRICQQLEATTYINAVNGKQLYTKETFSTAGIDLFFINLQKSFFQDGFDPFFSTLQALFYYGKIQYSSRLKHFELI
jgi:WbqC-like protein family